MQANPIPQNLQELQQKVAFAENVKRITEQIHAASDLDHILLDLRKEILSIFDAEDLTIFAFDPEKKEIFSKVPHIDSVEEFRIPLTEQSLAGFCAKYLRPVSIADAYNIAELQGVHPSLVHDTSYDKRTGFKTKQVLTYPIVADNKYLMGVLQIGKSLAQFHKCPYIEYSDRTLVDVELLKNLNVDYLKKNHWMPLKRDRTAIEILTDDPSDLDRVADIKRTFPGLNIRFAISLRRDIAQFLGSATGQGDTSSTRKLDENVSDILGELVNEAQEAAAEDAGGGLDENDNAIVRLANQIIADAYRQGASDIHVEPYGEKRETLVRFRVDGDCFEYMKIPQSYRRAIVSRLKIMASLDIAERRKPQDGKIKFKLSENKEIELRVATIPTAGYNEDVVMRLLAASEPLPLDKMGFSDRNFKELKVIAAKPYGIILCVGPTGSGKTTTLHSVLGFINTPDIKIWTAEDPVEITQYGLRQVQVQPKINFTFAAAMRAFLRADPDVIMVGEMRDKETADIGIEASLTGHLVMSTLHTNSAVETVSRLLDMGCDPFSFADAMLGVLAQRLTRRICKDCKEQYVGTAVEYEEIRQGYGPEHWDKLGIPQDNTFRLTRGKGCETCNRTGFKGRVALHELLLGSDGLKRMIQTKARTEEMLQAAIQDGMTTLMQDGVQKVLLGQTTFKEVKAVAIK
ncbi:MAG: general secretion pathway protein GspE [Nitrospira sp.]|nr:MAG: general secretion pathway protein GspE [Nitrospira sp.]